MTSADLPTSSLKSSRSRFPGRGLLVAGTDTDVGKTYIASLLARKLTETGRRMGVYKPAASGGQIKDGRCVCEDATLLWEAAGQPATVHEVCPQMFVAPLAPNLAAAEESRAVDSRMLTDGLSFWKNRCDAVIVEGAGGLLSPLADDCYVADVALEIGYPVLLVSANRLGTINQTLQTVLTATHYRNGLHVVGVVVNDVCPQSPDDPSVVTNVDALRDRCDVPVLGHVRYQGDLPDDVDWWKLLGTYP